MQIALKEITTISSGQTFRTKVENEKEGTVRVIQMKDLDQQTFKLSGSPHLVKKGSVSSKQLLQKGDILFLAKGNNHLSFLYDDEQPAVAVSFFFVIRPNKEKVVPEYLAWFLNQKSTQNIINRNTSGSVISHIKKNTLEELKIKLPEIKEQKLMANVYELSLKEQELQRRIGYTRRLLVEEKLKTIL